MTRSTPDRRRLPGRRTSRLAPVPGLLLVAVLATVDYLLTPTNVVIALVVLAPLLTVLLGSPRDVLIVGSFAFALVAVSALWRDDAGADVHVYRVVVMAAVTVLTGLVARASESVARERERLSVLAAIAEVSDGTRTVDDTVRWLNELFVPAIADICIVDALSSGELQRLAVRVAGSAGDETASILAKRPPSTLDELGDPEVPLLLPTVDDSVFRRMATDEQDLQRLRALDVTSVIVMPLRSRGRRLGTLTLIATTRSGRHFSRDDLDFAASVAERAALALDNAGLFSELETMEAQLTAALSTLAEAVTVQHAEGALIYANEAAARMLGFDSPQDMLATPVNQLFERFDMTNEDGSALRMDELPGARVLTGMQPGSLLMRVVDRRTGVERWRLTKASGVHDRDGNVKLVVNVIEDLTEVKSVEMTQRLLARSGELLASSMDYERTLQQVAELAVPQLADWCSVSLSGDNGVIRMVAVAHVDPEKVEMARRLGECFPPRLDAPSGVAQVLRDGLPQVVNQITDEMLAAAANDDEHLALLRAVGMHAGLVVPMSAGGRTLGAITLVSAESGRRFHPADVDLAREIARRAATAVENARLYTERSHIARTLQKGLLPGRMPQIPGWSVATLYRPAGEQNWVGGDFYDVFAVRGGWLALVGDVAGHGAEAAALTGLARYTLRTAAMLLDDPLEAIGRLNSELYAREEMALCSVVAVLLREREGRASAEIVSAGHPLPLLVRGGDARLVGEFSPMLGAYDVDDWQRTTVDLRTADVLVLYTDGVFDTVGADGRFGEQRLAETVAGVGDAGEAVRRIDRALSSFEVGEQADDTAVLAVERVATDVRPRGSGDPAVRSFGSRTPARRDRRRRRSP
ncbi:MAG: SpoIIE family protein phosphatase [Solirubrobacteraceae bacterium]